jgi:tungstate transport system ATP-binding protein
MGLLQQSTTGKVYFDGQEATRQNALLLRRRMASIFQEPLLLNASVSDNAALGLKMRGLPTGEIKKRLGTWLERLGIAHLASRSALTLSGGEAQRTSLARALALEPELLLLDEPFSALDPPTREALLLDLRTILKETGVTTVFVTHDRHEAFMLGQRVGVLNKGKLLQLGSNVEVFTHPVSEEVAAIVGVDTRIAGVIEEVADGMARVRFNGGAVSVVGRFRPGERVMICIRPEEISLSRPLTGHSSDGLNHVRAKVSGIFPWMFHYRLVLQSGDCLLFALMSRTAFVDLSLREGEEVIASFDPKSAHVIRSSGSPG